MKLKSADEIENREIWRRQCARNLMDCYTLAMEALNERKEGDGDGRRSLEALTMLMVDGMTSVRGMEDERAFYRIAAELCRACAERGGGRAGLFRMFGALFQEKTREEESHE